jgi:hypothetical protein
MYGNLALYHIRYECDRGRAIFNSEKDGLLPAFGIHGRVPVALNRSALREDAYDAKDAKEDLHDIADVHHAAKSGIRLNIMEEPGPIMHHLAGYGHRVAAYVERCYCQQTYVYF